MMDIELKRLNVEYKKVNSAREQNEYRIMELQEQIQRLDDDIKISIAKEEELLGKIQEKKNKGVK